MLVLVDDANDASNGPWTSWSLDHWTIDNHNEDIKNVAVNLEDNDY